MVCVEEEAEEHLPEASLVGKHERGLPSQFPAELPMR
jgi:hypothetical protein